MNVFDPDPEPQDHARDLAGCLWLAALLTIAVLLLLGALIVGVPWLVSPGRPGF